MNLIVSLYVALLFVLLTPGVLLTLPKGGKKLTVALVHGLIFALVYHFTHKMVWRLSVSMDGFQAAKNMLSKAAPKPAPKAAPKAAPKPAAAAKEQPRK